MSAPPTRRAAVVVFAALVVATFGAFFVAQNLKNQPSILQQVTVDPFFSPNSDGRFDGARIRFKLRDADRVKLEVVDADGDPVRTLIDGAVERYTPTRVLWKGETDGGGRASDGVYRYRFTLREQGRSIVFQRSVRLDTTPPVVRVTSIGPVSDTDRPRPELLPNPEGEPATVRFAAPAGKDPRKKVTIFKTGPGATRRVYGPADLPADATSFPWDGRLSDGRNASPGTYVVVVEARDQAGNIGTSVPLDRRGLPTTTYGEPFPGRGGITVRYLGVQPPLEPTRAGERGVFGVDARQERYTWSLSRLGEPGRVLARSGRPNTRAVLSITAPASDTRGGVYLLTVRTRTRRVRVPWVVRPSTPTIGTRAEPRGVLVVLPATTWQGRNPVDDDGDGLPDVLDRGLPVRLQRILVGAGDGLPVGFAQGEAPLLAHLDRTRRRYDVTTDVALAAGRGPQLADGYQGVILPGDVRWLDPRAGRALRAFARAGGTVTLFGTRSLQREVRQTPRLRLTDPTAPLATDLFGARLGALVRAPVTLTDFQDEIDLFAGTEGEFRGLRVIEPVQALGDGAERVAAAVTPNSRPVIVAARFGRGLVIRTGLPELPAALSSSPELAALVRNVWTLSRAR